MLNSILDAIISLLLWPLVLLWQMLDRLMAKILVFSVSATLFLIAVVLWAHVVPVAKPTIAPVQITQPTSAPPPAAAPCQPYYIHC